MDRKTFIISLLGLQIIVLASFISNSILGFKFTIINQVLGFIYLTFLPGLVLSRILRIDDTNNVEKLLFIIGLSLSFSMFLGLFANQLYHFFDFKPFSGFFMHYILFGTVFVLTILSIFVNKNEIRFKFSEYKYYLSNPALFLYLIPFLTVIGTYLMNFYSINILIFIVIILISIICLLVTFTRFIPVKLYPLAIFSISLSLLFHKSLISTYLWGWDIQYEYYLTNLVINNGFWDPSIFSMVNGMLSTNILAAVYNLFLNLDLVWVYKIIYPLLFAFMPLALFSVFKIQTNDKIAFLSTFFFVSFFVFYDEMLFLARQEIAELFFALIILLLVKNIPRISHKIMLVFFSFFLITSHYGLSYIFIGLLLVIFPLSYILKRIQIGKLKINVSFIKNVNINYVVLVIVIALFWYLYTASGSIFLAIVSLFDKVSANLYGMMDPDKVQSIYLITKQTQSPVGSFVRYVHLLFQFFIGIGAINVIFRDKLKFKNVYILLSIACLSLLISSLIVPFISSSLNTSRLYQITLIVLSPFGIIGAITLFKLIENLFVKVTKYKTKNSGNYLKIVSVLLVVFLLSNCGVFYYLNGEISSISFDKKAAERSTFNENEVVAASWIDNVRSNQTKDWNPIYGDWHMFLLLMSNSYGSIAMITTGSEMVKYNNFYIFLGNYNIKEGKMDVYVGNGSLRTRSFVEIELLVRNQDKIYDNGGANIFTKQKS